VTRARCSVGDPTPPRLGRRSPLRCDLARVIELVILREVLRNKNNFVFCYQLCYRFGTKNHEVGTAKHEEPRR
jgi:hypothetical protein